MEKLNLPNRQNADLYVAMLSLLRTGKRVFVELLLHGKGILLKVDPYPSPFSTDRPEQAINSMVNRE